MVFFGATRREAVPMMSRKCKYALKALICLGKEHGSGY